VFEAIQLSSQEKVMIKVFINESFSSIDELVDIWKTEVEMLQSKSKLAEPKIDFIDAGIVDIFGKQYYIIVFSDVESTDLLQISQPSKRETTDKLTESFPPTTSASTIIAKDEATDDDVIEAELAEESSETPVDDEIEKKALPDEKEVTVLDGINNYVVSSDGKKVLYSIRGEYGIVDIKENQKNTDGRLDLSKLEMKIFPKQEWEEIYVDGWRLLRDWFYDPNMHGLDWNAMKEKYGQLVPYVSNRMDLDYIFGELGGELSSGHVYVNWGDFKSVERKEGGLLGCELEADPSGYYKITKIYKGENWHPDFRSPLTQYGVNVIVGDYIIAIDGQEVKTNENPYKYLENKAGTMITLRVNNKPSQTGAHDELVKPVKSEGDLRYLDWVESRMKMVDELSGGKIGYIHIPNTALEGNRELFKYFYPQTNKEALIIDDRYNGGGFVPDRMIELLDRKILNYWVTRGIEPRPVPGIVNEGPKACLINGYSSSGGDAFPYYFRETKMGTIIGTRTWGGLIGISGNPGLMDGGSIDIPVFRFLDTDGNWAVENEGVYPDIEILVTISRNTY